MGLSFVCQTPIQELTLPLNGNRVFVKREDLLPFSFGGNKARKARLFFEDIRTNGSDCVVTYGSSSSNHCRVVANAAAAEGLRCIVVSPLENQKKTYNESMLKVFGTEIFRCPLDQVSDTIRETMDSLHKEGAKPYFIPGGGHGNLGTQAYVDVYNEIVIQEKEKDIRFDILFFACGTGTTQAGLICGKLMCCDEREIVGISIARNTRRASDVILGSVNDYLTSCGRSPADGSVVRIDDKYILGGYGKYSPEIVHTIRDVLVHEGIALDTTYTGKAFWGMKDYIKTKNIRGKNILFIHTGGTPLFFDSLREMDNE